jgi:hypothetical protein
LRANGDESRKSEHDTSAAINGRKPQVLTRRTTQMADQKLPPWAKDLVDCVGTAEIKAIVEDLRSYNPSPSQGAAAKVTPVGAGRVIDGDDIKRGYGWVKPPQVDQWKPPGLEAMDRMMDVQDAIDKAARAKELIEAAATLAALKPRDGGEDKT